MRTLLSVLGVSAIVSYAVLGAMLMNDWAVVAASGAPLGTTIADMDAAGQPYSIVPGIGFAAAGVLLALAWGAMTVRPNSTRPGGRMSSRASTALWGGILALGAPAYFFASFGNLNSVGDTYVDWNSEAAFALEAPLYVVSGIAFLVAVVASIMAVGGADAGISGRSATSGS